MDIKQKISKSNLSKISDKELKELFNSVYSMPDNEYFNYGYRLESILKHESWLRKYRP